MNKKHFDESIFDVEGRDYPKPKAKLSVSEIIIIITLGCAISYYMLRTIFTFA
jgi:hypothetical protein